MVWTYYILPAFMERPQWALFMEKPWRGYVTKSKWTDIKYSLTTMVLPIKCTKWSLWNQSKGLYRTMWMLTTCFILVLRESVPCQTPVPYQNCLFMKQASAAVTEPLVNPHQKKCPPWPKQRRNPMPLRAPMTVVWCRSLYPPHTCTYVYQKANTAT